MPSGLGGKRAYSAHGKQHKSLNIAYFIALLFLSEYQTELNCYIKNYILQLTRQECKKQVNGVTARFKKFETRDEADHFMNESNPYDHKRKPFIANSNQVRKEFNKNPFFVSH